MVTDLDVPVRLHRRPDLWLMVTVLVAVIAGYVYLAVQDARHNQDLSEQVEAVRASILAEVTKEREARLAEIHEQVTAEMKRQDDHTEDLAAKAGERATIAEGEAKVAKKKVIAVEKRTTVIEKKQKQVDKVLAPALKNSELSSEVPILVPTPEQKGGLLDFLFD